jgi:hypothetical protein
MKTLQLAFMKMNKESGAAKSVFTSAKAVKSDFGDMIDSLVTKECGNEAGQKTQVKKDQAAVNVKNPPAIAVKTAVTIQPPAVKQANTAHMGAMAKTKDIKKTENTAAGSRQVKTQEKQIDTRQTISIKPDSAVIPMAPEIKPARAEKEDQKRLKTAAAPQAIQGVIISPLNLSNTAVKDSVKTSATPAPESPAPVSAGQGIKQIKISEFRIEVVNKGKDANAAQGPQQLAEKSALNNPVKGAQKDMKSATLDTLKTELSASVQAASHKAVNTGDEYTVVIRINPPTLGEVEIKAKYSEGKDLSITITANSDTALIAVKAASEGLKNELSSMFSGQGTGVNVDVNQNSSQKRDLEQDAPVIYREEQAPVSKIVAVSGKTTDIGKKIYLA